MAWLTGRVQIKETLKPKTIRDGEPPEGYYEIAGEWFDENNNKLKVITINMRDFINKKEPKKELTNEQKIKKEVSKLRSEVRKLKKEMKNFKEYIHNDYFSSIEKMFSKK